MSARAATTTFVFIFTLSFGLGLFWYHHKPMETKKKTNQPARTVTITWKTVEVVESRDVSVNVDDALHIDLPVVIGAGYIWELTNDELRHLTILGEEHLDDGPPDHVGGSVVQRFLFKATDQGREDLKFVYCRPFDKANTSKNLTLSVIISF